MGSSFQSLPVDGGRVQRIQRVVDECLSRQVDGDALSIDAVAKSHADLMPELAEALRRAVLIGNARRRARAEAGSTFSLAGYAIVREIHRGGQGVVFEAVQQSTGRTVAIKWMRQGPFASATDRVRFEREVRILAQLNHPNIVTIHDSGVTAGGDSYFVMNYIPGLPLDGYVERISSRGGLTTSASPHDRTQTRVGASPATVVSQRDAAHAGAVDVRAAIQLFQKVCEAVHTAHLRGIIHRDLKPSNIRIDDQGEPHVLDFGLAKISDSSMGDVGASAAGGASAVGVSEFTQTGQFIGSLPWASPEQVEGRVDLIDIRTDVYSLGIVLYQMLTGRFPYPVSGHIRQVMDHITQTRPVRPREIRRELDDDIETIVLKCLAKEPDRRYQSAGEIAREIERYLAGEAIDAKRDSLSYTLRMQFRRHRVTLSVASGFLVLVLAGLGTSIYLWQQAVEESERAVRAERRQFAERRRAEAAQAAEAEQRSLADQRAREAENESRQKSAINQFLVSVLSAANPRVARNRQVTLRATIDEAARQVDEGAFTQSPRVEADIRATLGETYRSLGEYAEAEAQLRRSVATYECEDPECLDAARACNLLGLVLVDLDRDEEALGYLGRAVVIAQELGEHHEKELAIFLNSLADAHFELRDYSQAESIYRQALTLQRATLGDVNMDVAMTLDNLGMTLTEMRRYDESEPLLREALSIQKQVLDAQHPHLATTLHNLAGVLIARDNPREAETLLRDSLAIRTAVLGDSHPHVAGTLLSLARVVRSQHRVSEAEGLMRQALAIRRKAPDASWRPLVVCISELADLLGQSDRLNEAESLYREALSLRRAKLGLHHLDTAETLNNLAGILLSAGRLDEALAMYRESLGILQQRVPAGDVRLAAAKNNLGNVLKREKRYAEAEELHREVLSWLQERYPEGHPYVARSLCNLAETLAAEHKDEEAEQLYRSAIELQRRLHSGRADAEVADALNDLARFLKGRGRYSDAEGVLREAQSMLDTVMPPENPARAAVATSLAECLAKLQEFEEAEQVWGRVFEQIKENPAITARQRRGMIQSVVECYEAASRGEDAARWRARLDTPESP